LSQFLKLISVGVKLYGSLPFCVGNNHKVFVNGLAPVQIFHAIPSSVYSTHKRRAVGKKNRLKESSGQQVQKHATFAPASQKLLGFRLRSHKMGTAGCPITFLGNNEFSSRGARCRDYQPK